MLYYNVRVAHLMTSQTYRNLYPTLFFTGISALLLLYLELSSSGRSPTACFATSTVIFTI